MTEQQKDLTSSEIRNLFIIVQNELNKIKKQHTEDNTKLLNSINTLKEELNQKDKEIKSLKKTIDKLIQNQIESSKSLNKSLMHKDSKPPIEYTEEEIKYINTFNQKYGTKISGNERILDLSNDNDNNTANKPNQKLGNDELTYLSKFKFGRLQQLYLGKNNISDISVFANMKLNYLQKLSLANNTIVDISCLEKFNFIELKELYLYNNYISDISVLAKVKFKNLEKLSLFNNNISDMTGLEGLNIPSLKEIWLNGNGIDMAITINEEIYDKIRDRNIKIIV